MELKTTLTRLLLAAALALPGLASAVERININTADAAALDRIMDGVGPAKAAAIIEHRRVNGPFRSIDQLVNVKGIGLATVERNRNRVTVGAPAATSASRPAPAANRITAPAPAPRAR